MAFDFYDALHEKQREAFDLWKSGPNRILLYGGSRSGKTFLIVCLIVLRAIKHGGSRHLLARLRYAHARASLWLDTLPGAIEFLGVGHRVEWHESDHYITVEGNGGESEMWVDGLDDRDRVDKILGREYNTIFLNEVSQISYDTVTTVLTRLANNVTGCRNIAVYDCNPPSKRHWTYKQFILGVDPESGEPLPHPEKYAIARINPRDNIENLPEGYIEDILETLPEDKRRRFLLGEYGDTQGAVFDNWEIVEEIPDEVKRHSRRSIGLDFGFSVDPAAIVDVYWNGDDLWIDELLYETELTNPQLAEKMRALGITDVLVQADSAEPKSIVELKTHRLRVVGVQKGPDSIRAGIDWMKSKRIHVTKRSLNLINEFEEYVWVTNREGNFEPKPIDDFNHAIDAARYACDPLRRRGAKPQVTAVLKR